MKRKFLTFICLILFILSIACVSATEDVNQTVDDALSAKDSGTFTVLQEKINNASEGSTINLENDYKYDDAFGKEGITINKKLTVNGNGHTIDANSGARIFEICTNDVVLKNIKFINGNASWGDVNNQGGDFGAAIYNAGNNTNVINCEFIANIAKRTGGAIYSTGDFVISDCIFRDNAADMGSALSFKLGSLNIMDNCYFEDNPDSSSSLYIHEDLSYGNDSLLKTDFTNLKFNENLICYGGAIYFSNNVLSISGSHISDFISGNVYVDIEGKTFRNTFDSKGNANFDLFFISNGTWNAKISYKGDSNFAPFEINIPITIKPVIKLIVPNVTKDYGGPESLIVTLMESNSPVANANVTININGQRYTRTTDIVGKTSLDLNLNAGSYDAKVSYKDISTTAKVIINKLATNNTLSYAKNSRNSVTLTALINPSATSGDVVFTVGGRNYSAEVNEGKADYTVSNLDAGSYDAKAIYKGDVNHNESVSNSVKFTVEAIDINAPDLTKYYHGPERFVVTVKVDNKPVVRRNVTINLNNVPYTRTTDVNGQASIAVNLNSGVHTAISKFEDIEVRSTITVKPTISGENVTKIYRNDTQYFARFTDSNGNVLKNVDVYFNINGVFYTRTTSDEGIAKMNINLNPGVYVITATNPVSSEEYANIIRVLPSVITYDLTKYYKNASALVFKLLDNQGRPVGEGVKATININGVFYTRQSNASGYINMNINLNPGNYIATILHNGLLASSTVKVLPILNAKDVNMKYRDGTKFEATLLDGKGKPFANQTIIFNINGVFYNRTTDDYGVARLNMNLMAGEYIITSMYENGAVIANKVTIRS